MARFVLPCKNWVVGTSKIPQPRLHQPPGPFYIVKFVFWATTDCRETSARARHYSQCKNGSGGLLLDRPPCALPIIYNGKSLRRSAGGLVEVCCSTDLRARCTIFAMDYQLRRSTGTRDFIILNKGLTGPPWPRPRSPRGCPALGGEF